LLCLLVCERQCALLVKMPHHFRRPRAVVTVNTVAVALRVVGGGKGQHHERVGQRLIAAQDEADSRYISPVARAVKFTCQRVRMGARFDRLDEGKQVGHAAKSDMDAALSSKRDASPSIRRPCRHTLRP
jgi:hypothetical protein